MFRLMSRSFSTIYPQMIHFTRTWRFSRAFWKVSRMLLEQLGVQGLAMLFADVP